MIQQWNIVQASKAGDNMYPISSGSILYGTNKKMLEDAGEQTFVKKVDTDDFEKYWALKGKGYTPGSLFSSNKGTTTCLFISNLYSGSAMMKS